MILCRRSFIWYQRESSMHCCWPRDLSALARLCVFVMMLTISGWPAQLRLHNLWRCLHSTCCWACSARRFVRFVCDNQRNVQSHIELTLAEPVSAVPVAQCMFNADTCICEGCLVQSTLVYLWYSQATPQKASSADIVAASQRFCLMAGKSAALGISLRPSIRPLLTLSQTMRYTCSLNNEARVRVLYTVSYGRVCAGPDPKSVLRSILTSFLHTSNEKYNVSDVF